MTAYGAIQAERQGAVAILRLSDPATLNALSLVMVQELVHALDAASLSARAILLTGEGRGFCSGARLSSGTAPASAEYDAGAPLESHYHPLILRMVHLPIPVVVAVNGVAAGGGMALALCGDIIVAGESASFVQPFQRIALVPDCGSTSLLLAAAGRARAMEAMLLGERINARQALEWGLVNRVVPDGKLFETALDLAGRLAAGPRLVLGMIRRLGWEAMRSGIVDMLDLERRLQCEAGRAADHREGIASFLEKRQPDFGGNHT